jgi:pSer/pThr/pTyr-binding forkhead associated (FHA) protein
MIFDILRKESKKTKGVCLLKLNYKPIISIGRGSSSDIRMNDISVSRNHALLRLTPQGLFLEDNISKFGTLVLVKEPFPILKTRNNVYLQVGRTVIQANVKANWKYVMKHSKYIEKNTNEYKLKHNFFKQNNLVRAHSTDRRRQHHRDR